MKSEFKVRTRLREASSTPGKIGSKFQVILIQEGMGNLRDCFYYTKQSLESATALFEGKKCFVDHPSSIDEASRPERSTRDILGHFENVQYQEADDGRGMLVADLITLIDPSFTWAQTLLSNSIDYASKFPDSEFVGLSINASGEASEVQLTEFMTENDVPASVIPKLQKAQEEGISVIRIVNQLKDAVSCDLVTEAGAGGKILQMIEQEKRPMGFPNKKEMEKKEGKEMEKESGMEKEANESKEAEDPATGDHADADQDMALFKKMIQQYLGDDQGDNQEAMEMAKHAYEHHAEGGMEHEAAYEAAGKHLQTAMAVGKKMSQKQAAPTESEASEKEANENKESEAGDDDDQAPSAPGATPPAAPGAQGPIPPKKKVEIERHYEAKIMKANAEIARLRESLKKYELNEYLDKKLSESKKPGQVTKKFREALGTPKSKEHIDSHLKTFIHAYEAGSEGSDDFGYAFMEKTQLKQSDKAAGSYSDCIG